MGDVAGLHIGGQAVDGVVGQADRLGFGLVGQNGQHRAEDFLSCDRHVVAHTGEDGRADEKAAVEVFRPPGAADHQLRALVDARLDQALDLVELDLADHRADSGGIVADIAHHHTGGGGAGDRLDLVMAVRRHEHAGGRVAGLAAVAHHAEHALGDRALEIRIRQQDIGGLAPQLLRHALDRGGGRLRNEDAGAG